MTGPGAQNSAITPRRTLPENAQEASVVVHATSVCLETRAALITGPSGSGKSSLALQMMGLGAQLISDDQTLLRGTANGEIWLSSPETIKGMIEARGIGILHVDAAKGGILRLVVNLAEIETERFPERRHVPVLGNHVRCVHKTESPAFAAALVQYLKAGEVHDR